MPSRSHLSVIALCLALVLGAAAGCRTAPLVDPPPTAAGPTTEQSRVAIIRALANYHYTVDEESPGRIRARMAKNSWTMVIEVFYAKDISIHYADSANLDYEVMNDVAYIHRNYNGRVADLRVEIERQLVVVALEYRGLPKVGGAQALPQASPPPSSSPAPASH